MTLGVKSNRKTFSCNLPIRAKTREKDTYFEAGIAQSLEKWGKLMEKAYKLEVVLKNTD